MITAYKVYYHWRKTISLIYKRAYNEIKRNGYCMLSTLEEAFPRQKDGCYSYMQWPLAKEIFSLRIAPDGEHGVCYTLRGEWANVPAAEINNLIHQRLKIYEYND